MRFLLVDSLGDVGPSGARGTKTVAMSEDYLEWHFPERPILPGTLVAEALAQVAGWHEAVASDFTRWALLDRVVSARYLGFSGPGDRLDLHVEAKPTDDPARRAYLGEASVGGSRRAVVEFEAAVVPLEGLDDPARLRRLYAALRGEKPVQDPRRGRP